MHRIELCDQLAIGKQLSAYALFVAVKGFAEQQCSQVHDLPPVAVTVSGDQGQGIGFKQVLGCLGTAEPKGDELLGLGFAQPFDAKVHRQAVKSMRKAKIFEKSDERILGDGNFVEQVLSAANEQIDRKNILIAKGYNLEIIANKVGSVMEIDASEIYKSGKSRSRVAARSLFCFWAVRGVSSSPTVGFGGWD